MAEKNELEIRTPKGRISFPHVFTPEKVKNDDGTTREQYSCVILIPKDTDIKPLEAVVRKAAQAAGMVVTDKKTGKKKFISGFKNPIRDGDERDGYEGYADHWFISANSKFPVSVVGPKKNKDGKFTQLNEESFYSGCYAHMMLTAAAFDVEKSKGVKFYLGNIQKLEDGEPLGGGRKAAEDDFADSEIDETDDSIESSEESDDWG